MPNKNKLNKPDLMGCNDIFCALESKMIFYKQCDFMNVIKGLVHKKSKRTPLTRSNLVKNTCCKKKKREKKTTAVSLYFSPKPNPSNLGSLMFEVQALFTDLKNQFTLAPYMELTTPLELNQVASSINTYTASYPPYAILAQSDSSGFLSEELQFNQLVVGQFEEVLEGIEVGLWEILELIRHSDYIAISGARVSTGNHSVLHPGQTLINSCNDDFFTLKFTGFRDYTKEKRADGKLVLVPNKYHRNNNPNSIIPGTVWGSPCPPHWIPQ